MVELNARISVAPMMEWTDRYCRTFLRQITRCSLLYTEMVTAKAVLHGDRRRLLAYDPVEHPLALQLGGADPDELVEASRIGADLGFDEVNLNVGCPSSRVKAGRFGACLMAEPKLVAQAVAAMARAVKVPITVKHRIAIDDQDEWTALSSFVGTLADAGCRRFSVHARKAWLDGLSPKQNRMIPPLRHDLVYRLKRRFPSLHVSLNGGVTDLDEVTHHLAHVDGVMLGRAAYHDPYMLAEADRRFFADHHPVPTRHDIVDAMLPYIDRERAKGTPLAAITRHMLGLMNGQHGARSWRRHLAENAHKKGAGSDIVLAAALRVGSLYETA